MVEVLQVHRCVPQAARPEVDLAEGIAGDHHGGVGIRPRPDQRVADHAVPHVRERPTNVEVVVRGAVPMVTGHQEQRFLMLPYPLEQIHQCSDDTVTAPVRAHRRF